MKIIDIKTILDVRYSLQNIPDIVFEANVESLAEQLAEIDYHITYSAEALKKDWINLQSFKSVQQETGARKRVGLKLCEHFFPNFFDIDGKWGSFASSWRPDILQKVLRWNRKYHTGPYMTEMRRGIYFCTGMTKHTMYRPHIAKMICDKYTPQVVLDPCAGWGGRLLGAVASGAKYIGFETNKETYKNLQRLVKFLNIEDRTSLHYEAAENLEEFVKDKVDLVLTSPPYFNLEIYGTSKKQCALRFDTYEDWLTSWLYDVIEKTTGRLNDTGISCWNVHNRGKYLLIDDVKNIHSKLGFIEKSRFSLVSYSRPSCGEAQKKRDSTICYAKE